MRSDRDAELALHQEAVLRAADADDDVAQALRAEVEHPAHLDALGVDVQTLEVALGQLLVGVVALMLHAGVQRDHREVVGVHDIVDIARQAQRELGHRDQQGVSAAGRRALDVHGRAAGGLAQRAADVLAQLAEALDQAQRNGGLALAQRGGGDGGNLDELAVGLVLQALHDLDKVQLRGLAVGDDLLGQKAQLLAEVINARERLFGFLRDLPVFVNGGIKHGRFLLQENHMLSSPHLLRNTPS